MGIREYLNSVHPDDMPDYYYDPEDIWNETWVELPKPRDWYRVSDLGRIRGIDDRLLIPGTTDVLGNDLAVNLYYEGEVTTWRIWKLVTAGFFHNSNRHLHTVYVEYEDGNPHNVALSNYIYRLRASGQRAGIKYDRQGNLIFDNRSKGEVVVTDIKTGEERIFYSANEAALKLGLQQPNIVACLAGRRRTHKGYIFRYAHNY